jgi:squalene-hopene/tetraprenyl-beta-curcumene cyclase
VEIPLARSFGLKGTLMKQVSASLMCALCVALLLPASTFGQAGVGANRQNGLSAETRQRLQQALDKAETYLRQQQKPDGSFDTNPGITALAATAILRQPGKQKAAQMQVVGKTLDGLAKLAKPDGGIYEKVIPHYITAVSTMALVAGGRPQDKPLIEKARAYLAENLLDEGEGVAKDEFWYGGMGYGNTTRADGRRADMISLEYALRAMKEAELPDTNAAWQKAITFLQRAQNHSETNDQKWAANDGGFVYYPGFSYHVDGGTRSYGSVSYAGLLSYTWANVKKNDERVQAVAKWIRDNYTVDENPGMGQKTVYYYYMVFAKALQALGENTIIDARGRSHNWREELGRKLLTLQNPEGYWVNSVPDEMQDNKVLVTAFTMTAIHAILQ